MTKERLEEIKKAYITTDEVLNGLTSHWYDVDQKRAIKDFIFAINYLEQQNKRYREAIEFGIEYLKNSDIRQVQLVVTALKSALEGGE